MLEDAGLTGVVVALDRQTSTFASFEDFWSPIEAWGGRLGQAYLSLPDNRRERIRHEVLPGCRWMRGTARCDFHWKLGWPWVAQLDEAGALSGVSGPREVPRLSLIHI